MASHSKHPGIETETDDETRRILEERLLTIDADANESVGKDRSREEIRKLRESLKQPALH